MTIAQRFKTAVEHHRAGRLGDARAIYEKLLKRNPRHVELLHLLGVACHGLGDLDEAARLIGRAIALKPDVAAAHGNLGKVLMAQRKPADAAVAFRKAVALDPALFEAHAGLAGALHADGKIEDAAAAYRAALALQPNDVEALVNLGVTLNVLGRLDETIAILKRAIELRPDIPEIHNNLACALRDQGRFEPAMAAFRRALALRPHYARAHSNLISMMEWVPGMTVAETQAERRRWYLAHRRTAGAHDAAWPNPPDPERKLRLGYVSADFKRHSASYAFGPVLWSHDRGKFEVVCYSGVATEDDVTDKFRNNADLWRPMLGLSDDALAAQIRVDAIDVLIDLSGHSVGNRLTVFTAKPAPVQVTAWGNGTGTGIPEIDALFADAVVIPAEDRRHFAETVVDLPCFLVYEPPDYAPDVGPLPALAAGHVTFGCLNRFAKVSDDALAAWGRLLAVTPTSRLLLKDKVFSTPQERTLTLARLARLGIAGDRVIFQGGTDHIGHLAAYNAVDIALDPFPQNGGITTVEGLWMGVPAVTRLGAMPSGRLGGSLLSALGLGDLVTGDTDGYIAAAQRLANELPRLAALRGALRERVRASPLGNIALYVAAVEDAYRSLWRRWCARGHGAT